MTFKCMFLSKYINWVPIFKFYSHISLNQTILFVCIRKPKKKFLFNDRHSQSALLYYDYKLPSSTSATTRNSQEFLLCRNIKGKWRQPDLFFRLVIERLFFCFYFILSPTVHDEEYFIFFILLNNEKSRERNKHVQI